MTDAGVRSRSPLAPSTASTAASCSSDVKKSKSHNAGYHAPLYGVVLILQAFMYTVRYFEVLIRPNLIYILGFIVIHLVISRQIIGIVIGWERSFIDQVLYSPFSWGANTLESTWHTSDFTIRLLRWSQTKWLTFYLARDLRRKWRNSFKAVLIEIEGLKAQGVTLNYKKPLKSSVGHFAPHKSLTYYLKLGWFTTLSSTWMTRCILLFLSTPINTIPYLGPWIYMYIHSGIKARRICAEYSRTQGHWDRLQRRKFVAQTAGRMRIFACLIEVIEDSPLGCVLTPVLDMSVVIWMCHCKGLESLASLSVDKIEIRRLRYPVISGCAQSNTQGGGDDEDDIVRVDAGT